MQASRRPEQVLLCVQQSLHAAAVRRAAHRRCHVKGGIKITVVVERYAGDGCELPHLVPATQLDVVLFKHPAVGPHPWSKEMPRGGLVAVVVVVSDAASLPAPGVALWMRKIGTDGRHPKDLRADGGGSQQRFQHLAWSEMCAWLW